MNRPVLDDLLSLSLQLNRQAFGQPPVEGWLNSFLAMMCERFTPLGVRGAQVTQVIGNVAIRMAHAGVVPADSSPQYTLDASSPVALAMRSRQTATMPNARIYPVLVGNDAIGAMIIYTIFPGDKDASKDIRDKIDVLDDLVGALATQLGPALLNHLKTPGPTTGRLMRQIDVMRSLYEVTRDFSSALESHEILDRAARSLVETLRIDHVGIVVYDMKDRIGTCISEYPNSNFVGTRVSMLSPMQERLTSSRSPVLINNVDTATDLGPEHDMFVQFGIKSIALLPMIAQGEVIGSVGLDAFYDYHEFTQEEIEAAMAVTSQLAITAHNAQLYESIKRRANQLERITELSRRVTSTFDRSHIFQIAREETLKIIDADLICVALRNATGDVVSVYLLVEGGPIVADFPVERAALRFVFNTGEPIVLDDISGSDDPDYRLLASSRMRAAAIVPLIAGGNAIGAYGVLHREAGRYVSIDLAVLEQIGNQLAIALENARLYSQTSQRAETERLMNRLSGAIQSRGDLHSMLLNTVQEIAEALGARRARVRLEMSNKQSNEQTKQVAGRLVERLIEKRKTRT